MDPHRVEGKTDQARGKLRDWWGRLTGRPADRIRGNVEQGVGQVKEGYGRLKDEFRAERERQQEPPRPGRDEPIL
ncbi:MAG: CsbD family protein [Phycisphaerales bacterium]